VRAEAAYRLSFVLREPNRGSHTELKPNSGRPKRSLPRAVATLVVLAIAVTFVVQNRQAISVRLWFVTGHVSLLWLLFACIVLGGLVELAISRAIRLRWRSRRRRSS
jgi:uncharacterized integral membrane protein